MTQLTREELMAELEKKFPGMYLRTTEEFYGYEDDPDNPGGIWTSGESDEPSIDGLPVFDYYGPYSHYEFGVLGLMRDWLKERGWYGAWHDPGTIMLYRI